MKKLIAGAGLLGACLLFSGSADLKKDAAKNPVKKNPPGSLVAKIAPLPTNFSVAPTLTQTSPDSPNKDTPKGMRADVWNMAKKVRECAVQNGQIAKDASMAVIDYDLPSSEKRL